MTLKVEQLLREHERAKSERSNFDTRWQEFAELAVPAEAFFYGDGASSGLREPIEDERIFDDYARIALGQAVTIFLGMIMPRGVRWQVLESADKSLMEDSEVAAWYAALTDKLFRLRNDPASGWVKQTALSVERLLAFGNQSMWVDARRDARGRLAGLRYRSEPLWGITVHQSWEGTPGKTEMEYQLPAREIVRQFGSRMLAEAGCEKIIEAAAKTDGADRRFRLLQIVMPNDDIDPARDDWKGKPWIGLTIGIDDKKSFNLGGYEAPPRIYSRYRQAANSAYGIGIGMEALPAVRALQDTMRYMLTAAETAALPTLMAPHDALDSNITVGPNELLYGGVDARGQELVRPLYTGADLSWMTQIQDDLRRRLDRWFFSHLLLSNQEIKSHVTQEEILRREAEKGVLLSSIGQQESEWLSPMTYREIDVMTELGLLDDMPDAVADAGGMHDIRYSNRLSDLEEVDQVAGLQRTFAQLTPLAELKPEAIEELFLAYPVEKWVADTARINGAAPRWRATSDEIAAAREAKAQQQQMQEAQDAVPGISQAVKNVADAEAALAGVA